MMNEQDFPTVKRVLEAYGASTVGLMREALVEPRQRRTGNGQLRSLRTNAVASGDLERSLAFTVQWNGKSFDVEFSMAEHGIYVDKGRRPGKQPPIGPIQEWARIKGIPESLAFPIARKIGQEGIAARPFFGVSAEAGLEQLVTDLANAYATDTQNLLNKLTSK